jgi:hypothetical protein
MTTKETMIMKTTLSFTALALFTTSLLLPMQASAADRQISVNPKLTKIEKFTVNKDEQQAVDVATTAPDEPKQKVTPKAFRVDDNPVVTDEASNDETSDTPKPKKAFRFRVEDQSEQAAATPTQDDDEEVASSQDDRPANLPTQEVKLVKKQRPAPVESNDEEATTDDTDHSADIAADTNDDVNADTSEEPVAAPVGREKHRMYYYASKQNAYDQTQDDYTEAEPVTYSYSHRYVQSYQPRYYAGSSCRHSYNGY